VFRGESRNTNLIVLGLTRTWLEHTIYRTRGEYTDHYTTEVVHSIRYLSHTFVLCWCIVPLLFLFL